jgi:hypothetical protein
MPSTSTPTSEGCTPPQSAASSAAAHAAARAARASSSAARLRIEQRGSSLVGPVDSVEAAWRLLKASAAGAPPDGLRARREQPLRLRPEGGLALRLPRPPARASARPARTVLQECTTRHIVWRLRVVDDVCASFSGILRHSASVFLHQPRVRRETRAAHRGRLRRLRRATGPRRAGGGPAAGRGRGRAAPVLDEQARDPGAVVHRGGWPRAATPSPRALYSTVYSHAESRRKHPQGAA